ncbi:toprim domain-containing protein [Sediminibacterium soli]|uniref:toprim domain-containing protein n=1 Tax=Sediminibacterium soli TaxID=2698829 RepID=UPI00137A69C2|nr:toprim domain-containing protein [Sediminibacterium soli]NCI45020.1 DNA primase [Sediminibacterium soli]
MNCEQANKTSMVELLALLDYAPDKIRGNDYWYRSPFRGEHHASFKVNISRNIWYDHSEGIGGKPVDFAMRYFSCGLSDALIKLSSVTSLHNSLVEKASQPAFVPVENRLSIIDVIQPLQNRSLLEYLEKRRISQSTAQKFCKEVVYENNGKRYRAIGFKNTAGGYELRSENFKGSSSPKYVTWFDNSANRISVFEGFFDFLSWQTITGSAGQTTNVLVLNSLSFFTRSLLLQEKHNQIHLFLDTDTAGRKCVAEAQKRNPGKVEDQSHAYKGFKDLSEWHMSENSAQELRHSRGIRR